MNIKQLLMFSFFVLTVINALGQKGSKMAQYFGDPIVVDSLSTIIIPTRYNSDFLSSNKIALWGDFYANIIFYDFKTDSYKKLFESDTYIIGFNTNNSYRYNDLKSQNKNVTSKAILYRVKSIDHNKSGRIDNNDPAILYSSDIHGNNLRPLTTENENVVTIDIFEKQDFALIKIQRDQDNDGDFETSDKDFYFVKLDLQTFTFGNKIETK